MYQLHREFESVPDETVIWRYMDFPKFVSMLNENALHFASAESFSDKFEGRYTSDIASGVKAKTDEQKIQELEFKKRAESTGFDLLRANCWNISQDERVDFWERYVEKNGLAIQSTFRKLKESFSEIEIPIFIGKVKYIDYSKDFFKSANLFNLMLHKRSFFKAEDELRAMVMIGTAGLQKYIPKNSPKVIPINTNLETLVEKIILHPDSSQWIQDIVEKTAEKFGYSFNIEYSELSKNP